MKGNVSAALVFLDNAEIGIVTLGPVPSVIDFCLMP